MKFVEHINLPPTPTALPNFIPHSYPPQSPYLFDITPPFSPSCPPTLVKRKYLASQLRKICVDYRSWCCIRKYFFCTFILEVGQVRYSSFKHLFRFPRSFVYFSLLNFMFLIFREISRVCCLQYIE